MCSAVVACSVSSSVLKCFSLGPTNVCNKTNWQNLGLEPLGCSASFTPILLIHFPLMRAQGRQYFLRGLARSVDWRDWAEGHQPPHFRLPRGC